MNPVSVPRFDWDVRYEDPPALSRQQLESEFDSNCPGRIADALISAALYDPDWRWVQDWCVRFAEHADTEVRRVAITSIGHLARLHDTLDLSRVLPLLEAKSNDSAIQGTVEDTLSDIRIFVPGCGPSRG
jgi:hypothetical protein